MTNEKSIYGHENNFPTTNLCQFIHRTWGGVWVVIAISSIYNRRNGEEQSSTKLQLQLKMKSDLNCHTTVLPSTCSTS